MTNEAVRIISDTSGVQIIGKSPMAVRHGAYILLEKLGVRWFFKHPDWEVVPSTLIELGTFDETHDPAYFWRLLEHPYNAGPDGESRHALWDKRNRMLGLRPYYVWHNYSQIIDRDEWAGTLDPFVPDPRFLPSTRYPSYPWQLNPQNPEVMARALAFIRAEFASHPSWGSFPLSPNDGAGWDDTDVQIITDKVQSLLDYVARQVRAEAPDKLISGYCYALYSGVPTFNLSPNILVSIATEFNYGPLTMTQRIAGYLARGAVVGIRDYPDVWAYNKDGPDINWALASNLITYAAQGATHYDGESGDGWGGRGLLYYAIAKVLFDPTLSLTNIQNDFYSRAFGPAAVPMKTYYQVRTSTLAGMTASLNALAQAETLAAGNEKVLARIRQLQLFDWFVWNRKYKGAGNLTVDELKRCYVFSCKTRDQYIVFYHYQEADFRMRLLGKVNPATGVNFTSAEVDALQDFTPYTPGEGSAIFNEALSFFGVTPPAAPPPPPLLQQNLVPLGDTTHPALAAFLGGVRQIIVPSTGNESILVRVKGLGVLQWYNQTLTLLDTQSFNSVDWTDLVFQAPSPGNYVLHATRGGTSNAQIDLIGRGAAILADPDKTIFPNPGEWIDFDAPGYAHAVEQYFYVPENTSSFTLGATAYVWAPLSVIGTITDPAGNTYPFSFSGPGVVNGNYNVYSLAFDAPISGVWKIHIDSQAEQVNYFWFTGIPPLVWHNAGTLLHYVPEGTVTPPPSAEGEPITTIAILDSSDALMAEVAEELKTYIEAMQGQPVAIVQGDTAGTNIIRLGLTEKRTLNVTVEGNGSTEPIPGTISYDLNTMVPVSAIPAAGARFVKWTESGVTIGTAAQININMSQNHDIVAVFEDIVVPPLEYALTISIVGSGSTDPLPGAYSVPQGQVSVRANPASGWKFARWEGNINGSVNPAVFNVNSNLSIVAVFTENPPPSGNTGVLVAGAGIAAIIALMTLGRER